MEKIDYPLKPRHPLDIERYKTLRENWGFSAERLTKINKKLNSKLGEMDISIAVAGSYGRLEAAKKSDFDFIIISKKGINDAQRDEIVQIIKDVTEEKDIKFPNPKGIFSKTFSLDNMVAALGGTDDTIDLLGQRMLLLMEGRAIYNNELFMGATEEILKKYLEYVIADPGKEAIVLLNDLIRYFRSICVNYQYTFWHENEKWALRNAKLRHSRIILYAGLLLLIMNVSKKKGKRYEYILDKLEFTPMERIAHVYDDNGFSIDNVLAAYEVFLSKISDPTIRESLGIEYKDRFKNPQYMELKVSSELLLNELSQVIYANKGKWSNRIMGYLIF